MGVLLNPAGLYLSEILFGRYLRSCIFAMRNSTLEIEV
jgi:hypothetical protein